MNEVPESVRAISKDTDQKMAVRQVGTAFDKLESQINYYLVHESVPITLEAFTFAGLEK